MLGRGKESRRETALEEVSKSSSEEGSQGELMLPGSKNKRKSDWSRQDQERRGNCFSFPLLVRSFFLPWRHFSRSPDFVGFNWGLFFFL